MATPLRARKSLLPRIGALPMLANARECQPVGRPLLDAPGRSATGPDPLGLTPPPGWVPNAVEVQGQPPPPEWNCALCLSRLDGPAEEEENTAISFEATVYRDYIEFTESHNSHGSLYAPSVYTVLGYDPTDLDVPIQSVDATSEYGGPGQTWVRIAIRVDRDGRQLMERIGALARSQEQTAAFFGYPAVINMASITDAHEDRYVVQQLEVCGHQFHRACLKKMFSGYFNRAECPECKQYIIAEEVEYLRSDFTLHDTIAPMMQGDIDRYDDLITGPDALIRSDPKYVAGDTRYTELYTRLVQARRTAQAALDGLAPTVDRARQKQPGELNANGQRIATWQQMSSVVNPQGNGLPPRRQFPLPPDQERSVLEYIRTLFEGAVQGVATLFPVREDGVYPARNVNFPGLAAILSDDALMNLVRIRVQSTYTNANTPLTPGNAAIFLNTWKALKAKAMKTGTTLSNQSASEERAFTQKLLEKTYERMLAEASLDIDKDGPERGRSRLQDRSAFDRIARAGQAQVLGTRMFHDYEDLNREIQTVQQVHDTNAISYARVLASSYLLIDIALRTHPLLDCNTELLKQTVRFLHARNHADFRRHYEVAKYFVDAGIWNVVREVLHTLSVDIAQRDGGLCTVYSNRSLLDSMIEITRDDPEAMRQGIAGWLELIRPDVIKIVRSVPWRRYWTTDDLFNAVTLAYLLREPDVDGSRLPARYSLLWSMLKDELGERIRL